MKIGEVYNFEVIKRVSDFNSNRLHTILTDSEGFQHFFPYYIISDSIDLKIENIKEIEGRKKVFFNDNIFNLNENETSFFSDLKFIRKNNHQQSLGFIIVEYGGYHISVNTSNWLMHDDYNFSKRVKIQVNRFNSKNNIEFIGGSINHIHYNRLQEYDFEIISHLHNNLCVVKDPKSKLTYKAKKHFSNLSNDINYTSKFLYLGFLKKSYDLDLREVRVAFLEPSIIFNVNELELIKKDLLIDYEVYSKFKNQLLEKDNFWIISLSRYLQAGVISLVERGEIDIAANFTEIQRKLLGFASSSGFIKNFEKSQKKIVKKLDKNRKDNENNKILIEFLKNNKYSQLYDISDQFEEFKNNIDIIRYLIKSSSFRILNLEDFVFFTNKLSECSLEYLEYYFCQLYYPYVTSHILKVLDDYHNSFFFNREEKKEWLFDKNLDLHIYMLDFFKSEKNYALLNDSQKLQIKSVYLLITSIANDKFGVKQLSEEIFDFIEDGFYFSDTLSLIKDNSQCFFINSNKNNHLYKFFENKLSSLNFITKSKLDSKISNGYLELPEISLFNKNSKNLKENEDFYVIIKNYLKSSTNRVFVSYDFDHENLNTKDGLLTVNGTTLFKHSFPIGKSFKVKLHNIYDDKPFFTFYDERFNISYDTFESDFPFDFEVAHIVKEKCKLCSDGDLKLINDTTFICNKCNMVYFPGAFLYNSKKYKYIFINKKSVHGVNGYEFMKSLKEGDVFKFSVGDSNKFSHTVINNNKEKEFYQIAFNVHPGSILIDKRFNINKFAFKELIKDVYMLIDECRFNEPDLEHQILDFQANFAYALKTPRSYVNSFYSEFLMIYNKYKKRENFDIEFNKLKIKTETFYKQTILKYPNVKKLFSCLEILKLSSNYDFQIQLDKVNENDGLLKNLAKLILIKNLIIEENQDNNLISSIDSQINDIILNKGSLGFNLQTKSTVKFIKEPEEIAILKDIENNITIENQQYEFKETLKTPVLTNKQLALPKDKLEEVKRNFNINDKDKHVKNAYAVVKNICAFLNTNNGYIIIGVNDRNELVGLEEDYKLLKDFDGIQKHFENIFKHYLLQPEKFRNYVNLKRIQYQNKDFAFIRVDMPAEFDDACYIKKINSSKDDIIYVKGSGVTNPLEGTDKISFRRKRKKKDNEPTFVYLMEDSLGYTKIGISKDPKARKGTLMSQDPGIELLSKFIFPSRDFAYRIEQILLSRFERLNNSEFVNIDNDVRSEISEFLLNQSKLFLSVNDQKQSKLNI